MFLGCGLANHPPVPDLATPRPSHTGGNEYRPNVRTTLPTEMARTSNLGVQLEENSISIVNGEEW